MTVDVKAVDAAMDAVLVSFDRLLQLVEDGGLQQLDDQSVSSTFLQGYERVRNRLRFVERQAQLATARASRGPLAGRRPSYSGPGPPRSR